jgi:hypothetical protein
MSDTNPPGSTDPLFDETPLNHELENEILQMKLKAEFGADTHFFGDDLSAELQNDFLKSVYAFEHMHSQDFPGISVYEKIGKPYYLEESDLSDSGIKKELERVRKVLFDHNVVLDVGYEYEPRKIYGFITNELFVQQIENMDMPGYYRHFIYEEFHPNHEEDLRSYTRDFINAVMAQDLNENYQNLHYSDLTINDTTLEFEKACERIKEFYNDFESISVQKFEISSIEVNETDADVHFQLGYEAALKGDGNTIVEGDGCLHFVNEFGHCWFINKIRLPGLAI